MTDRPTRGWLLPGGWWLTMSTALLAAVAGAAGLVAAGRIYGRETATLADAATAQDIVTLLPVAPLMALLAVLARRGSLRAFLCLLGCLAFTAYNYAIYAFSVQFGPLFLLWVAVLGLSIFALVTVLTTTDMAAVRHRFTGRAMPGTAWFLIAVATLFVLLWLREIVPDLLSGAPLRSAGDWRVPTNPVHVLDLAFFLPSVIVSGVSLRRRHPLGYTTAAAQLVWFALTCLPILMTPVVSGNRGHGAGWAVTVPIGCLLLVTLVVLHRLLRRVADTPAAVSATEV